MNEYGLYNTQDQTVPKFYTTPIYKDKQGHTKIALPPEMCIEKTDMIAFYWEPVGEHDQYVRRICKVIPESEFKKINKEERNRINPRKVMRRTGGFQCGVPITKLNMPKPREGKWSHMRFHISSDPNMYFIEFLQLMQAEYPEDNSTPDSIRTHVSYAQNPHETPKIRW